jgi:hypothetical protein
MEGTGERVIESTQRADGSWRKPVRIRAGYKNDDDRKPYTPPHRRKKPQTPAKEQRGELDKRKEKDEEDLIETLKHLKLEEKVKDCESEADKLK